MLPLLFEGILCFRSIEPLTFEIKHFLVDIVNIFFIVKHNINLLFFRFCRTNWIVWISTLTSRPSWSAKAWTTKTATTGPSQCLRSTDLTWSYHTRPSKRGAIHIRISIFKYGVYIYIYIDKTIIYIYMRTCNFKCIYTYVSYTMSLGP